MELRRRARPTSSWERARFVSMWISGMSLRAIARQTGSSVTTVYRWIQRWQNEGHINTRNRIYRSLESSPQYCNSLTKAAHKTNEDSALLTSNTSTIAYSGSKVGEAIQRRISFNKTKTVTPQPTNGYSNYVPVYSGEEEVHNLSAMSFLCYCEWHRHLNFFQCCL